PELGEPRRSLWPLYFPRSELPRSLPGFLDFVFTRTLWLFRSAFAIYKSQFIQSIRMEDYRPNFDCGSLTISLAFLIGTIRSLFSKEDPRFPLALYTLLVVGATLVLSVLGFYPYGIVRYLLFLMTPIFLLAALGFRDVFG